MMAAVLVAVALVPLTGGSLGRLGRLSFRGAWLIYCGLGLQVVITTLLPDLATGPSQFIHLGSYGFVLAFLLANRHLPGLTVVVIGTLCNVAAIAANQGVMPAQPGALRTAGIVADGEFANSAAVDDAKLWFLGDVFAVPASMPLANVFSVGDVLIVMGASTTVLVTGRRRDEPDDAGAAATGELGEILERA